eukprot:1153553-Pelagomonas_calceolata.AAC.3
MDSPVRYTRHSKSLCSVHGMLARGPAEWVHLATWACKAAPLKDKHATFQCCHFMARFYFPCRLNPCGKEHTSFLVDIQEAAQATECMVPPCLRGCESPQTGFRVDTTQ